MLNIEKLIKYDFELYIILIVDLIMMLLLVKVIPDYGNNKIIKYI